VRKGYGWAASRSPVETHRSEFIRFVSWDPDLEVAEIEAFLRFGQWLTELQTHTGATGLSLRAYCYNKAAKNCRMRRRPAPRRPSSPRKI
jgi:hypothetical protein